jgi:hypothetical protein
MANRRERRRTTKIRKIEERVMRVEELINLPSMCAWEGCYAHTTKPHKHGWSSMLLYKGEPQMNFEEIDPRLIARDCVLCPEHARHLDEYLLLDIGGRLRSVEGAA